MYIDVFFDPQDSKTATSLLISTYSKTTDFCFKSAHICVGGLVVKLVVAID